MNREMVACLAGLAALIVPGAPARAELEDQTAPPDGGVQPARVESDPNFQVDTTVSATRYSISYPAGISGTSGTQEILSTTIVGFGTPLHDDDSPYSLQTFMQRVNTFSFSIHGGHFDTANPNGGVDRTDWDGGLGAGFDSYVKQWFAVFASGSYYFYDLRDVDLAQTIHSFRADAGIGLRYQNSRLNLSAAETGDRTSGASDWWRGSLTMSLFTVIKRRVALTATGTLVRGGGEGSFEAELFPTKSVGVFTSAFAGRFEPYAAPALVTRYIGRAGAAVWFDAWIALVGQYSLTYERGSATPPVSYGYDELSHTILFQAYFRLR